MAFSSCIYTHVLPIKYVYITQERITEIGQ